MNKITISEIIAMSGYGKYVWAAFGIVILTLLILFFFSKQRLKKSLKTQKQLLAERNK